MTASSVSSTACSGRARPTRVGSAASSSHRRWAPRSACPYARAVPAPKVGKGVELADILNAGWIARWQDWERAPEIGECVFELC